MREFEIDHRGQRHHAQRYEMLQLVNIGAVEKFKHAELIWKLLDTSDYSFKRLVVDIQLNLAWKIN